MSVIQRIGRGNQAVFVCSGLLNGISFGVVYCLGICELSSLRMEFSYQLEQVALLQLSQGGLAAVVNEIVWLSKWLVFGCWDIDGLAFCRHLRLVFPPMQSSFSVMRASVL